MGSLSVQKIVTMRAYAKRHEKGIDLLSLLMDDRGRVLANIHDMKGETTERLAHFVLYFEVVENELGRFDAEELNALLPNYQYAVRELAERSLPRVDRG